MLDSRSIMHKGSLISQTHKEQRAWLEGSSLPFFVIFPIECFSLVIRGFNHSLHLSYHSIASLWISNWKFQIRKRFSNILKDGKYKWYRNHIFQIYKNWNMLMRVWEHYFKNLDHKWSKVTHLQSFLLWDKRKKKKSPNIFGNLRL